jgi:hypothetical protein
MKLFELTREEEMRFRISIMVDPESEPFDLSSFYVGDEKAEDELKNATGFKEDWFIISEKDVGEMRKLLEDNGVIVKDLSRYPHRDYFYVSGLVIANNASLPQQLITGDVNLADKFWSSRAGKRTMVSTILFSFFHEHPIKNKAMGAFDIAIF